MLLYFKSMQTEQYQKLGWKTFWVFLAEWTKGALIIGLVTVIFIFFGIPFAQYVAAAFLLVLIVTVLIAWIEYRSYGYLMGADAFKVKRGVIHKDEVAIPYRQIQTVNIERPLLYQLAGTSKLVILTAGQEDEDVARGANHAESEGIIPVMDKELALKLQSELLSKANIQKVNQI